jgi:hypothetical protein
MAASFRKSIPSGQASQQRQQPLQRSASMMIIPLGFFTATPPKSLKLDTGAGRDGRNIHQEYQNENLGHRTRFGVQYKQTFVVYI